MKDKFSVSIVIPAYNEEENLSNLIEDLKKLTYDNFNVYIGDDGSTDNTRKILSKHDWIEKYYFEENKGAPVVINSIVEDVDSDYILQLDADIRIYDEKLIQKLLENFEEGVVAVWGGIGVENDKKFFPLMMKASKELNPSYLYGGANVMFKTDFLKSHPYDEGKRTGADFEMREKVPEFGHKNRYESDACVEAIYPEGFFENISQRFRYAQTHIRLMKRRFKKKKLIPIFRDWTVAGGLILLPFVDYFLWTILFLLILLYFFYRAYKSKEVYKVNEFAVYSVFAEIFFVFVRSFGYLREVIK